MIHYHGLPITPEHIIPQALFGAHFFVSFEYPQQLAVALEVGSSFAVDNGAYSRWKSGKHTDWKSYYQWIEKVSKFPSFDFAVIPDVIDGTEVENDVLLHEWPHGNHGAPVWHLHESLTRLQWLCSAYLRVCIGSSGQFAKIGTTQWWKRMYEAMAVICVSGVPDTKLHGLRMMKPEVFSKFPFKSVDSTNIARNIGIDSRWKNGAYLPPSKAARACVMRQRIESKQGVQHWEDPMNDPMF